MVERSFKQLLAISTFLLASNQPVLADANRVVIELNNGGVTLLKAGEYAKAIHKFTAALKLDPTYKLAQENLGIAYNNFALIKSKENNHREALMLFEQAAFISPNNTTTLANIDQTLKMMGHDPKNVEDRLKLGNEFMELGATASALGEYEAALRLRSDQSIRNKEKEAIDKLSRVEPGLLQIHQERLSQKNSASVAATKPQSSVFDTSSTTVAASKPAQPATPVSKPVSGSGDNSLQAEVALLKEGKYEKLIDEISQTLAKNPGSAKAHYLRGRAYYHTERFNEALADEREAVRLKSDYLDAYVTMGDIAVAKSDYATGVEAYTKAIQIEPTLKSLYTDRATCYDGTKEKDLAAKDREHAKTLAETTYRPEGALVEVDFGPYMESMQKKIKANWHPIKAESSYRVVTMFKIHHDGKISHVVVSESSGLPAADKASLTTVESSVLSPLPAGSPPCVDLAFTFDYNVHQGSPPSSHAPALKVNKSTSEKTKPNVSQDDIKRMIEEEVERRLKEKEAEREKHQDD